MINEENGSFIRWQSKTIEQLGFVNNLGIGLSIVVIGFLSQITFNRDMVFSASEKCSIVVSFSLFLISLLIGVVVSWNRLQSFRNTAQIARKREKDNSADIEVLRKAVDDIDKWTWRLFPIQIIVFILGIGFWFYVIVERLFSA